MVMDIGHGQSIVTAVVLITWGVYSYRDRKLEYWFSDSIFRFKNQE